MSGPDTLILHVGYGKTGSSALQSSFALSQPALEAAGICYPSSERTDAARQGQITSGNVPVDKVLQKFDDAAAERPGVGSVLMSNEGLFQSLLANPGLVTELAQRGVRTKIVLYIRDPLKHAISLYGQGIKRGGETGDLASAVLSYRMPLVVGQFLTRMEQVGAQVSVLNYSRCKKHLLSSFANVIGVPENVLTKPPVGNVNRSLTPSELFVQRCFNEFWGASSSKFVSDELCNKLPDQRAESQPYLSRDVYQAFKSQILPILADQNRRLPPEQAYVLETYEEVFGEAPSDDERYSFTADQLRLLVQSVSNEFPDHATVGKFAELMSKAKPGYTLTRDD
ncbi:MAG: hypothetical protein ABJZ79_16680, partial [Parasphingorhabdus sp.]|uniref:hypothetical protein n=1 Tax=Parasphingorhabdus sp. TaxID=2709688 RepID=UPI003298D854